MTTCNDQRVPRPATGKTPIRNVRIADEVWLPAMARADITGSTATDAVEAGLRMYAAQSEPGAYEFTFANWPDAAGWRAARSAAFAVMESELDAATGFLPPEWLAIATWVASTHHEGDPVQQKRVITGHVLRRALSPENGQGPWRGTGAGFPSPHRNTRGG